MNTDTLAQLVTRSAGSSGPGLAVGVYFGGTLVAHAEAGSASVEFGVPITERTRFDIASMSKQFAATAVVILARDGLIDLDDDIRAHLPMLRLSTPVTISQCLLHTGGLPEWLQLAAIAGRSLTRITQNQTLEFVSDLETVNFAPGSAFDYSNTGYVLAASLVHRITGRTLGEFAADKMFAPLGMNRTLFREDSREVLQDFAYGYENIGNHLRRADSEECAVGDGGLVTSVSELGAWFRFLRDGDVLGEEVRDILVHSNPTFPDGTVGPYTYGLYHTALDDEPVIAHAGGVAGYRSQMYYLPGRDLGVVVLANYSAAPVGSIATQVACLATDIREPARPLHTRDDEAASDAEGWWMLRASDESVRVESAPDGALILSGFQGGRFTHATDGRWYDDDRDEGRSLVVNGDRLVISTAMRPGRDLVFVRCSAPDSAAVPPAGSYLSAELGTLAIIDAEGGYRIGLELSGQMAPGSDSTFRAGPVTVRRDGDDLLLSAFGVNGVRFVRQPDGTLPLGLPRGLDRP